MWTSVSPWVEAMLREEWRVRREDGLLAPGGGLAEFVSVDDAAEGKVLRERLSGLNRVLREEQRVLAAKVGPCRLTPIDPGLTTFGVHA